MSLLQPITQDITSPIVTNLLVGDTIVIGGNFEFQDETTFEFQDGTTFEFN